MNNHTMQNDQEIFADNAAPFKTIKLLSVGKYDGCVKKHVVDIADSNSYVSKQSQFSAQSNKSVTIFKQKQYWITSISMNNNTHTLFVANDKGIIKQFQKEEHSLNYYPVRTFKGHIQQINSISLSNSKMLLLSVNDDQTLIVWDLENGNQLTCLNVERKEHQSIAICRCCWNDEDTLFASGDKNGDVVLWSPPLTIYNSSNHFIPLCKLKVQGDTSLISQLKFQENGLDLFASYWGSNRIRLWSINEKVLKKYKSKHQQNATLPLIQQPKRESEKLNVWIQSFDMRGSMLVVGGNKELLSLSADSLQSMANKVRFEPVHEYMIDSIVFSKDGKYVASGSGVSVDIFDSKSGKCVMHIQNAHSKPVQVVVFQI